MTEANKKYRFETLQLHVGQEQADPATDSRAVPIYATTSYVFHNFDHAEARFGLADPGNIYGRLTNSTQGVFEDRIAALEGGTAGIAVASGAAAVEYAVRNITQSGDHIVSSKNIYGGTFNLLKHTLPRDGITTTFVDPEVPAELRGRHPGEHQARLLRDLRQSERRPARLRGHLRNRPQASSAGDRRQHLRHPVPVPPLEHAPTSWSSPRPSSSAATAPRWVVSSWKAATSTGPKCRASSRP